MNEKLRQLLPWVFAILPACDKPREPADAAPVAPVTAKTPATADPPAAAPSDERKPVKLEMVFEDKLLATIPDGTIASEISFSPVGHQVAYIADADAKQLVVLGDERGEPFDRITGLYWSPAGTPLAYSATQDGKTLVVVGAAKSELYGGTSMPKWSPDGAHLVYAAGGGLVVDDKKIVPVAPVWEHHWTPDNRLVYIANQSPNRKAVIDGDATGESFEYMLELTWSPDGTHLAYGASVDDAMFLVADGKKIARPGIDGSSLRWSPDGKRLAYSFRDEEDNFVLMLGEEQSEAYEAVSEAVWSPDSSRVAYAAKLGGKYRILGDLQSAEFDEISAPRWSPSSKQIAYVVNDGKHDRVVVGDATGEEFDKVFSESLVWSPDSTKVAFVARQDGEIFVIAGDAKSVGLDFVDVLHWSGDGSKVAYGARLGGELRWMVLGP
jgi:Tol biopolymer transport system component